MNASQYYNQLLAPQSRDELQNFQVDTAKQTGITLRDGQILDAMSMCPIRIF